MTLNRLHAGHWGAQGLLKRASCPTLLRFFPSSPRIQSAAQQLCYPFFLNHVPSFSAELSQLGLRFSHVSSVNQITPVYILPFFALSGQRFPYVHSISYFIFGVCRPTCGSEIGFGPWNWTKIRLFSTSPISHSTSFQKEASLLRLFLQPPSSPPIWYRSVRFASARCLRN
jgi:hypothetical protein